MALGLFCQLGLEFYQAEVGREGNLPPSYWMVLPWRGGAGNCSFSLEARVPAPSQSLLPFYSEGLLCSVVLSFPHSPIPAYGAGLVPMVCVWGDGLKALPRVPSLERDTGFPSPLGPS